MKRIAAVLCFVACCSVMGQTNSLTIDGFTYENPRFDRVTTNTVTIFHSTGVATIPLDKLPVELQRQFGYDPIRLAQEDAARKEAAAKAEAAARAPLTGQELTAWKCALDYLIHADPYLNFSGNRPLGKSMQKTPTGDYLFTFGGRGKNPEENLGASSDSVVEINVIVTVTDGELRVGRVFYK
ncbi:MAG TPA: hypothetical protein VLZ30_12165 [Verrucomicrobiae bacterium]|nr:hypothetical protein [Verrucomicrobiae bacterium]